VWTLIQRLQQDSNASDTFTWKNDSLWYKDRLYLCKNSQLKQKVLLEFHTSPVGGNSGFLKTYHRVKKDFFGDGLKTDVQRFVAECLVCQQNKVETIKTLGILQPLAIPSQHWEEVSMDFITGLPTNQQATLEDIEDQGSIAWNRENLEEVVYQINGWIVTKEEWDAIRIEWRERAHMENQGDNEEELHQENPQNNEDQVNNENTISTLVFPISDVPIRGMAPMKNIPLSALSNFHGLSTEDPDEFLFEFDVLCRSYDYTTIAQKPKLFPATLKGNALRWFMSLGGENISTWVQMRQLFLNKYQDYCRTRERREELFKMSQKEDETLEYFVERLQYNLQRSGHLDVSKDILKTIFLRGVREDCLDMLNILGKGDISKESYEDIVYLCKRCSRGSTRNKSATKDTTFSRVWKSVNGGATRAEIRNMLENFKT
jgi:hypothetical protein